MLKSVECKQELVALKAQIDDLTAKGEAAAQELLDQYEAKKSEYIAALEKEMEEKQDGDFNRKNLETQISFPVRRNGF